METRKWDKLGIETSLLGFGCMRFPVNAEGKIDEAQAEKMLDDFLADYEEPVPGAKDRVRDVLRIMLTAWLASRMMQETEKMITALQ